VGVGLFWSTQYVTLESLGSNVVATLSYYLTLSATLIVIVILRHRFLIVSRNPIFISVVSLLVLLGTAEQPILPIPVRLVALLLSATGFAALTIAWGIVFVEERTMDGPGDFAICGLALLVAMSFASLLSVAPRALLWLSAIAPVLVSGFALYHLNAKQSSINGLAFPESKDTAIAFHKKQWRFYTIFGVYGLLYGIRQLNGSVPTPLASHTLGSIAGIIAAALLIVLVALLLRRVFEHIALFMIVPILSSLGLLSSALGILSDDITQFIFSFAHGFFFIYVWVFIIRTARGSRDDACFPLAFGRFCVEFGTVLGLVASLLVFSESDAFAGNGAILITVIVILFLSTAFLLPKRLPFAVQPVSGITRQLTRIDVEITNICATLAVDYDLSERETEVCSLLVQGWSQVKIAQTLFIAPSTVKTHTLHIYKKLGIRTKGQLIDLFREAQLNFE
jgi:DNA-binding CsgD family transcriptional regulator